MSETGFQEVADAIIDARILMHHRDYCRVMAVASEHLGEDRLVQRRQQEFQALPDETKAQINATGNFGIYGVFHLVSQPEVPLALCVVARELSPDFNLEARDATALSDPEVQAKIGERFPAFTPTRIQSVLKAA